MTGSMYRQQNGQISIFLGLKYFVALVLKFNLNALFSHKMFMIGNNIRLASEKTPLGSCPVEPGRINNLVINKTILWHLTIARDSISIFFDFIRNVFVKHHRPVSKFSDFSPKPGKIFKNVILKKLRSNATFNMWRYNLWDSEKHGSAAQLRDFHWPADFCSKINTVTD
jgi:hypothetical protein